MSTVAFHSPNHDSVCVGGGERAWADNLCRHIAHGVLGLHSYPALDRPPLNRLLRMIPNDHYIHDYARLASPEATARAVGRVLDASSGNELSWNGQSFHGDAISLNTALIVGGDALRFSARMHGSCEIHGWVNGPNRVWLANIIEEGLTSGVLRPAYQTQHENWSDVAELLRRTTHAYDAEVKGWNALSWRVRWDQAFAALQAANGELEMRPENWAYVRFSHGLSAFDILAEDWEARLNNAFP